MPTPPAVTASQMAEVDRLMVEVYRVSLVQMMEQAGLHLARLVRRFLGNRVEGRSIAVVCGKGNNGGGGMVAARHLLNWGGRVRGGTGGCSRSTQGCAGTTVVNPGGPGNRTAGRDRPGAL